MTYKQLQYPALTQSGRDRTTVRKMGGDTLEVFQGGSGDLASLSSHHHQAPPGTGEV